MMTIKTGSEEIRQLLCFDLGMSRPAILIKPSDNLILTKV
jgi:hypothetical protein